MALFVFSEIRIDSDCVEIWFPAAGGRNNSTGAVYNASSNGNYWSSSPYDTGTNGGYLNFNKDGGVNPRNNTNRANGLSVRCVSEFRRLFLIQFYVYVLSLALISFSGEVSAFYIIALFTIGSMVSLCLTVE